MTGSDLARTDDFTSDFYGGLEDFAVGDMKLGRLTVVHADGVWKDSLSNEVFKEIFFIPLAFVKQRVMWQPTVEDDAMPLCKSTNHDLGFPTVGQPKPEQNFPWGSAKLNPADFPVDPELGRPTIPCASCRLKEWNTDPVTGKKPWCTEQHSVPVLYGATPDECINLAVITFQRSSISASKAFFAGMARAKKPAFAVIGKATLLAQKRGTNTYHVPQLSKYADTDPSTWGEFSDQARTLAEYLREPPQIRSDSAPDVAGIAAATTWAPSAPAVAVGSPVMSPPAGAVVSGAVITTAPAAPMMAPMAPAPVVTVTTASPVTIESISDDELPF